MTILPHPARAFLAWILVGCAVASPAHAEAPDSGWAGAWGYATSPASDAQARSTRPAGTYRYRLRLTQGGDRIVVRISNPEAAIPLVVSSVTVAPAQGAGGYDADPKRMVVLSFAHRRDLRLTAASFAASDPARLRTLSGEDVIVTVSTAAESTDVSGNAGFRSLYVPTAPGAAAVVSNSRPLVSLVSVHDRQAPCTIVALGDSITEGARNTDPQRRGWPDRLADRLAVADRWRPCGVVNAGISGNRLLADGRGASALARWERDVADVPGVTHVVLLEGINDIVRGAMSGERPVGADDIIAGYRHLIGLAHARAIRIIGGTLTPGWGYRLMTPDLERTRDAVNRWIRTSGEFDGVIDFEASVRDDATPPRMRAGFDSGDHLHPGDAGYQAMADAVPIALFARVRK